MMTTSHTSFIGSIPHYYDQYLGPLIFEEYGADLARRVSVPSGGTVLETAAGTGIATRHLRSVLPKDVQMVVTDLNEPMLKFAKRKFDSFTNMEFQWNTGMYTDCRAWRTFGGRSCEYCGTCHLRDLWAIVYSREDAGYHFQGLFGH